MSRDLLSTAEAYARSRRLRLVDRLRDGTQGSVWLLGGNRFPAPSALKIHSNEMNYRIERNCYLRLREHDVTSLVGFNVPWLLNHDDDALALEMTVVKPPYVLDFAQASLDFPSDFSPEVWEETFNRWSRNYGEAWPRVRNLLGALEELGIFYLDVHRGNVAA